MVRASRSKKPARERFGTKGERTRQRLIEAAVKLLHRSALRDLRVADVARVAKTSPATFYVYFGDVSDVVLAATQELSQSTPAILSLLEEDWAFDRAPGLARALVTNYVEFWDTNRTLFRARNLAAEEGDQRFILARQLAIKPMMQALAVQAAHAQEAGSLSKQVRPEAIAATLMAMLERIAAVIRIYFEPEHDQIKTRSAMINAKHIIQATAHVFAATLGIRSSDKRDSTQS